MIEFIQVLESAMLRSPSWCRVPRYFAQACSSSAASSVHHDPKSMENTYKSVVAVNAVTNERTFVGISENKNVSRKFRREFNLPQKALKGLRETIIACDRPAKQLQNEADQLALKLEQRKFPASPDKVKKARNAIKKRLSEAKKDREEDAFEFDDVVTRGKIKEAQEYELRNAVDKELRKTSFNWRPLHIEIKEAAAAYALARLAPNYAEISRCLEEFSAAPGFTPKSVLDYGSGSGAGLWAVTSQWPESEKSGGVGEVTLVDTSDAMTRFAIDTIRNTEKTEDGRPFVHKNVSFRRHLVPSLQTTYDLVIAHRVLCELPSEQARLELIESLWRRTNRYLVLIESSLVGGFEAILEGRDYLLSAGVRVDVERLISDLQDRNAVTEAVVKTINDEELSDYERFCILREQIPSSIELPTVLPTASVFAPCPHDMGCPLSSNSVCSFTTRYKGVRTDGKTSEREKDGTETSKFTFVIMEKGQREPNRNSERIIKNRKLGKHVTCDICTAFRGIQRITLTKSKHDELYSKMRARREGDLSPVKTRCLSHQGIFNSIDK